MDRRQRDNWLASSNTFDWSMPAICGAVCGLLFALVILQVQQPVNLLLDKSSSRMRHEREAKEER